MSDFTWLAKIVDKYYGISKLPASSDKHCSKSLCSQ
jgi:hypothetical protein